MQSLSVAGPGWRIAPIHLWLFESHFPIDARIFCIPLKAIFASSSSVRGLEAAHPCSCGF
jgi:hypothetical protein